MATIDDVEPKWTQSESLIGVNPGLGFRPLPAKTEDGALVWYSDQNATTGQRWIDLLDQFLKRKLKVDKLLLDILDIPVTISIPNIHYFKIFISYFQKISLETNN